MSISPEMMARFGFVLLGIGGFFMAWHFYQERNVRMTVASAGAGVGMFFVAFLPLAFGLKVGFTVLGLVGGLLMAYFSFRKQWYALGIGSLIAVPAVILIGFGLAGMISG